MVSFELHRIGSEKKKWNDETVVTDSRNKSNETNKICIFEMSGHFTRVLRYEQSDCVSKRRFEGIGVFRLVSRSLSFTVSQM